MGLAATTGTGAPSSSFDEVLRTETLILIGANPYEAHPVLAQKVLERINKEDLKLIVIDPRKTYLAKLANLWLPLKPGTDVALLNGIAYVILKENLYNKEFIEKHVENFEGYREYILSEWDLVKVQRITEINPVLIEKTAMIYAKSKSGLIWWGVGLVEHRSGSYAVMAASNLALLCGFYGKPGCGAMPLRGHNNVQGACDMGALPYVLPGYQRVSDPAVRLRFKELWGTDIPDKPGLNETKMYEAALKGDLKALYIIGYNIAATHANLNFVWKALENLEFMIVQDIFMTRTAQMAHVVLPAESFLEKEGTFTNGERRIQKINPAVKPPGEALPDWKILQKLANRLGFNWDYETPEDIWNEIRRAVPAMKGITYERLEKTGIQWPCPDENHPGTELLFTNGFPTYTGKAKLVPPKYISPEEHPDKEYPFLLITGTRLYHFRSGSMTNKISTLKQLCPYEKLSINPEDAKKLEIYNDSLVKLKSRRGEITVKVEISDEVPPGIVFMDFHFEDTLTNLLTSSAKDELADTPEYKITTVKIKKL